MNPCPNQENINFIPMCIKFKNLGSISLDLWPAASISHGESHNCKLFSNLLILGSSPRPTQLEGPETKRPRNLYFIKAWRWFKGTQKWLSGEALQTAVKRREAKSKGEKVIYKHLNAEFQRIASRDKKAFFSDQCKEIEENNGMGKTRDLFRKIRYQRNISCKNGLNKGQKWYGPNRSRRY